ARPEILDHMAPLVAPHDARVAPADGEIVDADVRIPRASDDRGVEQAKRGADVRSAHHRERAVSDGLRLGHDGAHASRGGPPPVVTNRQVASQTPRRSSLISHAGLRSAWPPGQSGWCDCSKRRSSATWDVVHGVGIEAELPGPM